MARKRSPRFSAHNADKHVLYQESVQAVELDAAYIDRLFKRFRGRRGHLFKEDFCGTAALSCEWVKRHRDHRAFGVDIDCQVLQWAKRHNISQLAGGQQARVKLINDDVVNVHRPKVDIAVAMNFSYFVFKTRLQLREYFRAVRKSLNQDGLFLLDAFGGSEAQEILEETRPCKGFTYIWEHADFSPITNEILCHIHFKFPDGSRMRKAFTYDWRLWSLPELREVLLEAGFGHSEVHWERD